MIPKQRLLTNKIEYTAAEKSAAFSLRKDIESTGVLWYNIYVKYTAQKHKEKDNEKTNADNIIRADADKLCGYKQ